MKLKPSQQMLKYNAWTMLFLEERYKRRIAMNISTITSHFSVLKMGWGVSVKFLIIFFKS